VSNKNEDITMDYIRKNLEGGGFNSSKTPSVSKLGEYYQIL